MFNTKDKIKTVTYKDTVIKLKNTFIHFTGGGYDGCIYPSNVGFWDSESVWHPISIAGFKDETEQNIMDAVTKLASEKHDKIEFFSEEQFSDWAKDKECELLSAMALYVLPLDIVLCTFCDDCGKLFPVVTMKKSNPVTLPSNRVEYRKLKCEDCYGKTHPTCTECGEELEYCYCNEDEDDQTDFTQARAEALERLEKRFDIEELRKEIQTAYNTVCNDFDTYLEDDVAVFQFEELVSGVHGQYQAHILCKLFEIEGWQDYIKSDSAWEEYNNNSDCVGLEPEIWEELIEPFFAKICSDIELCSHAIKLELNSKFGLSIAVSHCENDGSFGFNILVKKEYDVKCNNCGFAGLEDDLIFDVKDMRACPDCKTDEFLDNE